MKQVKKINLKSLSNDALKEKELATLTGGCIWCWCGCGCEYQGSNPDDGKYYGSSTSDNDNANDSNKDGGSWW